MCFHLLNIPCLLTWQLYNIIDGDQVFCRILIKYHFATAKP